MAEEKNNLVVTDEQIEQALKTSEKKWLEIKENQSLTSSDNIVSKSPREYIDSDPDEVEEKMMELESYAYTIQRLYNEALTRESDGEDAFTNAMTYYSLQITDAKTEKEKEKRCLASNPNLIKLQKIYQIRRKTRVYLEKTVDRIEAYVNTLKLMHRRRFSKGLSGSD